MKKHWTEDQIGDFPHRRRTDEPVHVGRIMIALGVIALVVILVSVLA